MTKRELLSLIAYIERRFREELGACAVCTATLRNKSDHADDCPIARALREGEPG